MPLNRILLWSVIAFGLDRLSKLVIVEWMNLKEIGVIIFLDPFLNFRMGWNRGINFGLFSDSPEMAKWILIAVAFAISGWLFWWSRKQSAPLIHIGSGLIIGGALGNVWDRFQYGAVADYLNMSCCGISNPYTFNVADIFIFAGAGLLIFATHREDKKKA